MVFCRITSVCPVKPAAVLLSLKLSLLAQAPSLVSGKPRPGSILIRRFNHLVNNFSSFTHNRKLRGIIHPLMPQGHGKYKQASCRFTNPDRCGTISLYTICSPIHYPASGLQRFPVRDALRLPGRVSITLLLPQTGACTEMLLWKAQKRQQIKMFPFNYRSFYGDDNYGMLTKGYWHLREISSMETIFCRPTLMK